MESPSSAQAAASQPFGSMHEARSANGVAAVAPRLWQSLEIDTLRRIRHRQSHWPEQ